MPVALSTTTTTAMETVINAMGDVWSLVGTTISKITEQPILLFLLAAGLVPLGIKLFSRLKKAAR